MGINDQLVLVLKDIFDRLDRVEEANGDLFYEVESLDKRIGRLEKNTQYLINDMGDMKVNHSGEFLCPGLEDLLKGTKLYV